MSWIVVGETPRVRSTELEGLIGEIGDHRAFDMVWQLSTPAKDWPSRAHSTVMQDKGKAAGERREGGEEGEEMAWGRGRAHDRGRVELTRVSLGISGAG